MHGLHNYLRLKEFNKKRKLKKRKKKEQATIWACYSNRLRNFKRSRKVPPTIYVHVFVGADPKSVLCIFFKQGACTKGDKCKFSHDLAIERKTEKKNLYEDERNEMDDWNQEQLEDVISKKHGAQNKGLPPTTLVISPLTDHLTDLQIFP